MRITRQGQGLDTFDLAHLGIGCGGQRQVDLGGGCLVAVDGVARGHIGGGVDNGSAGAT